MRSLPFITHLKVSFIWGDLIFREAVKSELIAYFAVCLIMAGLYGMSFFSTSEEQPEHTSVSDNDNNGEEKVDLMRHESSDSFDSSNDNSSMGPLEISERRKPSIRGRPILICGKTYSRRNIGLCSALICGVWGGSCLVPMHYAQGDVKGLAYVISFSVGALTVTVLLWVARFAYHLVKLKSVWEAYEVLPSFHLRVMLLPGATAGSLWSLGNVGSIVAVKHLGQGVGYSASQAALLVSGMWGIFYFKVSVCFHSMQCSRCLGLLLFESLSYVNASDWYWAILTRQLFDKHQTICKGGIQTKDYRKVVCICIRNHLGDLAIGIWKSHWGIILLHVDIWGEYLSMFEWCKRVNWDSLRERVAVCSKILQHTVRRSKAKQCVRNFVMINHHSVRWGEV